MWTRTRRTNWDVQSMCRTPDELPVPFCFWRNHRGVNKTNYLNKTLNFIMFSCLHCTKRVHRRLLCYEHWKKAREATLPLYVETLYQPNFCTDLV